MMPLARFDTFQRNRDWGQMKFMFFLNHLKPLSTLQKKVVDMQCEHSVHMPLYILLCVRTFCCVVALVFEVIVDGSFVRNVNECGSFHSHRVPQGLLNYTRRHLNSVYSRFRAKCLERIPLLTAVYVWHATRLGLNQNKFIVNHTFLSKISALVFDCGTDWQTLSLRAHAYLCQPHWHLQCCM